MPRDKKTDPLPGEDLTAQELTLVEAVVEGASYADAYKAAYGAEGYAQASLWVKASRKVHEPKIQRALAQIRAIGLAKVGLRHGDTLERRIAEEYAFFQDCRETGNMGAAGQAYDRINKLEGLYIDQVRDVTFDPVKTLEEIAKLDKTLAARLAEDHQVAWDEDTVH